MKVTLETFHFPDGKQGLLVRSPAGKPFAHSQVPAATSWYSMK